MNEIDVENVLFDAVEEITTSGKMHLDEKYIKVIKCHCKLSNKNIKVVYNMILKQLEKEHSQIRYSCVLIVDELFSCSHFFRCMLLNDLRKFFAFTLETEPRLYPLPLPAGVAKELKLFTLKTFYSWYKRFSNEYRRLQLGFDYLKNVRCINISDISIRSLELKQKVAQDKENEERIIKTKLDNLDKQLSDFFENIMSTTKQLEKCYTLLIPSNVSLENTDACDLSQTNFIDSNLRNETGLAVKCYALDIELNSVLIVKEDSSNRNIIKSMQDLYTESVKQIVQVKSWLNILTKYDSANHEKITRVLKLKKLLAAAQDKYHELDIVEELEEENDFVDVPEKEFLIEIETTEKKPSAQSPSKAKSAKAFIHNGFPLKSRNKVAKNGRTQTHQGWRCEQKRACGFLLSSGKQCPRTDKIKCPFHGIIVERDVMGTPIKRKRQDRGVKKKQLYDVRQRKIIEKDIDAALGMKLSKQHKKRKLSNTDKRKELKKKQLYDVRQRKIIEKDIDAALGMKLSKQHKKRKLSNTDKRKARYSRLIKIKKDVLKTKPKKN